MSTDLNRWWLVCHDGCIHGTAHRCSEEDADNLAWMLDQNIYTHCGPHTITGENPNREAIA